jgi:PRC-barrel domain
VRSPAAPIVLAQHQVQAAAAEEESAADRMRHRFPQPVRVGDLIGLRVLDYNDVTIGIVGQVVRTPEARILLIVAHTGVLGLGGRLVAVPVEAVAILGRQLASLDMMPKEYAAAPTWTGAGGEVIAPDEKILIGLTRR